MKVSTRSWSEQLATVGAPQPIELLRAQQPTSPTWQSCRIHRKKPKAEADSYSGMTKIMPGLSFVGSSSVPLFASRIFGHCPEF